MFENEELDFEWSTDNVDTSVEMLEMHISAAPEREVEAWLEAMLSKEIPEPDRTESLSPSSSDMPSPVENPGPKTDSEVVKVVTGVDPRAAHPFYGLYPKTDLQVISWEQYGAEKPKNGRQRKNRGTGRNKQRRWKVQKGRK